MFRLKRFGGFPNLSLVNASYFDLNPKEPTAWFTVADYFNTARRSRNRKS